MAQSTVTIPAQTIEKLAALGKAMISLAEDMRKQATRSMSAQLKIPIPDLTRPKTIPKGEEWFWSDEWLPGEREANEDLKRGDYITFDTADDALRWLQEQ